MRNAENIRPIVEIEQTGIIPYGLTAERVNKMTTALNRAYHGEQIFGAEDITTAWKAASINETLRIISCGYREFIDPGDNISFLLKRESSTNIAITNTDEAYFCTHNNEPLAPSGILIIRGGKEKELGHPADAMEAMKDLIAREYGEATDPGWQKLLEVSDQAVENEALSIAVKKRWDKEVVEKVKPFSSMWEWVGNEDLDSFDFFTRLSSFRGRYMMAFSKMKLPLPIEDVIRYSPEFGFEVPVTLTALHKSQAEVYTYSPDVTLDDIFTQQYGPVYSQWRQVLLDQGLDPNDYLPLPVHPLSMKLVKEKFAQLISNKNLIIPEDIQIATHPTLSFRSMLPRDGSGLNIKLPVPVQATGALRLMNTGEVISGPTLSTQMAQIHEEHDNFGQKLYLERDMAGVRVKPGEGRTDHDTRYLSCLLRQNPRELLRPGEIIMPLAALFATSPVTHKPVIAEIMASAGIQEKEGALAYFKKYSDLILGGQLAVLFNTGVSYEAHQQNLNLVFDKTGQPVRTTYHDLVAGSFVYIPGYNMLVGDVAKLKSVPYLKDDMDSVINQFVHTNLWSNLFSLAHPVSYAFDIDRKELFQTVRQSLQEQIQEIRTEISSTGGTSSLQFELLDALEKEIIGPDIITKGLFSKLYKQAMIPGWGEIPPPAQLSDLKFSARRIENPLFDTNN